MRHAWTCICNREKWASLIILLGKELVLGPAPIYMLYKYNLVCIYCTVLGSECVVTFCKEYKSVHTRYTVYEQYIYIYNIFVHIDTCEGSHVPLCCAVLNIVMCTHFLLCCPLLQTVFWQKAFSRCLWSRLVEADTDKEFWQVSKPNCKLIFCLCVACHMQAYTLMPLESVDST